MRDCTVDECINTNCVSRTFNVCTRDFTGLISRQTICLDPKQEILQEQMCFFGNAQIDCTFTLCEAKRCQN